MVLTARYHDIGKMALPIREILQKEVELSEEEREKMEAHTIVGAWILWWFDRWKTNKDVGGLHEAMVVALLHQSLSKWYPFSINMSKEEFENKKQKRLKLLEWFYKESQIKYFEYAIQFLQNLSYETLQGRWKDYAKQILAIHIADIYDALRENRPYRDAMEPEQAVKELKQELEALDESNHPLYELWTQIKPQLTPEFLEGARKQALQNPLGD